MKTLLHSLVDLVSRTLEPTGCSIWLRAQADRTAQVVGSGCGGQISSRLTECLERDWTWAQVCPLEEINCPSLKAALEAENVEVIAPLIYQSEVTGWLGLGRPRGRAAYSQEEIIFLEVLTHQSAVAVACLQLKLELESYVHQLRQAYHQTMETQEAERRQLSEALHDETLQHLADLSVRLGLLRSRQTIEPAELEDLQARLARADQRLREIVRGLHPSVLSDLGLVEAIIAFFETVSLSTLMTPVRVEVRVEGFGSQRLPDQGIELTLFRFVQNAATNALVHGLANRITVLFTWGRDWVEVRVEDDGQGMKTTLAEAIRSGHFGLLSMRERIMAHGGAFHLASTPGRGTQIAGRIPLATASPEPAHVERYTFQLVGSTS